MMSLDVSLRLFLLLSLSTYRYRHIFTYFMFAGLQSSSGLEGDAVKSRIYADFERTRTLSTFVHS